MSPNGRKARHSGPVTRIGRILDILGLLFFLVGGGVLVRAWMGYGSVPAFERSPDDGPWAAIQLTDGFHQMQRLGFALSVVGMAILVLAWWVGRRRDDPSSTSQS